uniref:Uncharacterized protein n=1 Tax=Myotis myotis TaxID=51298 RepID=A0A7J7SCC2_MYOMY|nr:hypothetical protein mMyoMyo1_009446 [Myotis myotis]
MTLSPQHWPLLCLGLGSVSTTQRAPQAPNWGLFLFVTQKPSWALGLPRVLKCAGKVGFPPSRKATEVTGGEKGSSWVMTAEGTLPLSQVVTSLPLLPGTETQDQESQEALQFLGVKRKVSCMSWEERTVVGAQVAVGSLVIRGSFWETLPLCWLSLSCAP